MIDNKKNSNRFFTSIWIVFFILLISYSVYILLVSPDLLLSSKPATKEIIPYTAFRIILGLYFFIAVFNIKKITDNRLWLWVIVVVGLISRIILIPSQPVLEDDYYRYLWDGAVTAHGYNPFKYSPADAMNVGNQNVPEEIHKLANDSEGIIKHINYPQIRTIYPMLSQFVFAAAYTTSPWAFEFWKVYLLVFDIFLLFLLIKILKHLRLPLIFVSIYWLNPIVLHEFFNAAHMDLLALLFVMLSLYLYLNNKMRFAVIILALATGFKLWPVVLLPLILRKVWYDKKQLTKLSSIFVGFVILIFLPVILSNPDESLGFVKYAEKWVNNAAFYTIYKWVLNQLLNMLQINVGCLLCLNRLGVLIIYVITAIFIFKKVPKDNYQFFTKALLIVAVLYLISPTQFPWYYTWFVPLLVIRPKASLFLYPLLLPLYQIKYLSGYIIYIEHIPVLLLFILEMKGLIWKNLYPQMELTPTNS